MRQKLADLAQEKFDYVIFFTLLDLDADPAGWLAAIWRATKRATCLLASPQSGPSRRRRNVAKATRRFVLGCRAHLLTSLQ